MNDIPHEPGRAVSIAGAYDVVVAGGGPAGSAAAIAAARAGARTLLIEAKGALGGVWTSGLLTYVLDAGNKTSGFMAQLVARLEAAEGAPLRTDLAYKLPWVEGSWYFDPETMRYVLERWCGEVGVEILYHARVVAALRESRRIAYAITESPGGRQAWAARTFVDATGNGDLGHLAGCPWKMGRDGAGRETQPLSLLALIGGIDEATLGEFIHGGPGAESNPSKRLKAALAQVGIEPSYGHPALFPAGPGLYSLMSNHQYKVRCDDAMGLSRATLAARAEVHAHIAGLRGLGGPWAKVRVVATAEQIGIREGRRLEGRYVVTSADLARGARFDDAVCRVNFPVDIHALDPELDKGFGNEGVHAQPYDIPLRALIAASPENLLMAGRCLSGDFAAHASYRVTGDAAPTGEAAGACAALAALRGIRPDEVAFRDVAAAIR